MSEISIFQAAKRVVYESRKVYDRYPGLLEEVAKLGVPADDPFNVAMVELEAICTQAAKSDKGGVGSILSHSDIKSVLVSPDGTASVRLKKAGVYGGKMRDRKAKKVIHQ